MRLYEFQQLEEKGKIKSALMGIGALAAAHSLTHPDQAPEPKHQIVNVDPRELKALALTMWGEARNQGEEGMRAVGHVIRNRAAKNKPKLFGSGIEGVAHAPKQFSAWNKGDPNRQRMNNIDDLKPGTLDYTRWEEAQKLAASILNGSDADPTKGSVYYHTTAVSPKWAQNAEPVAKIGNHLFYNDLT